MTLTLDDQLCLDNLEAVTVTSVRPNSASVPLNVTHAARYPGLTQEAAISFGVVDGADNTWTFSLSEVALLRGLKPRDTIRDSDGIVHRVLTATKSTLANFWRVATRAIAIASDLCDRVDIYRPAKVQGQDDAGNREPVFVPWQVNVACRFQETGRQRATEFGKAMMTVNYDVLFEDSLDLTDKDQLRHDGKIYDVLGYQDADRLDAPSRAQAVWRF